VCTQRGSVRAGLNFPNSVSSDDEFLLVFAFRIGLRRLGICACVCVLKRSRIYCCGIVPGFDVIAVQRLAYCDHSLLVN
jgi:hypothetical protein